MMFDGNKVKVKSLIRVPAVVAHFDTVATAMSAHASFTMHLRNKDTCSYHGPDPLLWWLAVDGRFVVLLNGFHQTGPDQCWTSEDGEHLSFRGVTIPFCAGTFLWKSLLISCEMLGDSHYFHLIPPTVPGRS